VGTFFKRMGYRARAVSATMVIAEGEAEKDAILTLGYEKFWGLHYRNEWNK
jgi:hypothetical protein